MRKSIPAAAGLVLTLVAASIGRADEELPATWADPPLEDALSRARIVVRGHIQAPQSGETEPRLLIEKIVAGDGKPGVSVPLHGTRVSSTIRHVIPGLEPGTEGIFILREAGDAPKKRLELFTPSFGRFEIEGGMVAGSFRNSFLSVTVKADDYETFLQNAWAAAYGVKPDTAFVDSCRKTLAALDPTSATSAAPAHVALEGLRLGAEEKDAKLATRFFAAGAFQMRVSAARVLERAGGAEAGDALLRLAFNDTDPVVQATAIESLARVKPTPQSAVKELLAHLDKLAADATVLRSSPEDPRTNEQAGPMYVAYTVLRALGAADEATTVALKVLAKDDVEPFMASVLHLAKAKAKARAPEIVGKFRPSDNPYTFFNEKLGELLEELTGQKLGASKEAWQTYLKNEKK